MVVQWYVKVECLCCQKGLNRKLVLGKELTAEELCETLRRYSQHREWYCKEGEDAYHIYTYAEPYEPSPIPQQHHEQPPPPPPPPPPPQLRQMQQPQYPPLPPQAGQLQLQLQYVPPPTVSPQAVSLLQLEPPSAHHVQQPTEDEEVQHRVVASNWGHRRQPFSSSSITGASAAASTNETSSTAEQDVLLLLRTLLHQQADTQLQIAEMRQEITAMQRQNTHLETQLGAVILRLDQPAPTVASTVVDQPSASAPWSEGGAWETWCSDGAASEEWKRRVNHRWRA